MKSYRALGVLLLVLGGLLVANPLYIYQHPDEEYRVQAVTSYDGTPAANYTYEDLSPRAQELTRRAIEADSMVTFHGDHRRPNEFDFGSDENATVVIVGSVYAVDYQGSTYYLRTSIAPPIQNETRRSRGLMALGALLLVAGAIYVFRALPLNLGMGMAGIGSALLALNVKTRFAPDLLAIINVFGSSVFIVFGMLVSIVSVGYLVFRINRQRQFQNTS